MSAEDDVTPEPISSLVVHIANQMTMDAHYTSNQLIAALQPDADKFRILRDAVKVFAAGIDSKREEARLLNLMYWVDDLSDEAARSAIQGASYHDSNLYIRAKQQAGQLDRWDNE